MVSLTRCLKLLHCRLIKEPFFCPGRRREAQDHHAILGVAARNRLHFAILEKHLIELHNWDVKGREVSAKAGMYSATAVRVQSNYEPAERCARR